MKLEWNSFRVCNFLILQPKHVVGSQKNHLSEMVLLSTQKNVKTNGKGNISTFTLTNFLVLHSCNYSKTCVKRLLKNRHINNSI